MQSEEKPANEHTSETKTTEELSAADCVKLAAQIKNDIDKYAIETYGDPFRTHLGASEIGHECAAYLWFKFRWCTPEIKTGRMLRLFQRGHREEPWFIELLRGIGCRVETHDEDGNQFRFSACGGHYGGSRDAKIWLPEDYGVPFPFLGEFKTQGTGGGFNQLCKKGVRDVKERHFIQMCAYGSADSLAYALYLTVNKNDDDLHVEIVKLDETEAARGEKRANDIITATEPPPKVAAQETFYICKSCPQIGVCHRGEKPAKNCRSCKNAEPVSNAGWLCKVFQAEIPKEFIPQGCDQWAPIVNGDEE